MTRPVGSGRLLEVPDGLVQVVTDASYRDGRAAIAVAGNLGEYVEIVPARGSNYAEEMALLLAMGLVFRLGVFYRDRIPNAHFYTDYTPMTVPDRVRRYLECYRQWKVIPSHRSVTQPAHRLALRALRREMNR
jgi:hypothetical protein